MLVSQELTLRSQLPGERDLRLFFRLGLREECHDREHYRHHKSESYGPKRDLLASCCRPAAGNNIFCLERSGLRLLISARYREPSLGCAQIVTAQHKAF